MFAVIDDDDHLDGARVPMRRRQWHPRPVRRHAERRRQPCRNMLDVADRCKIDKERSELASPDRFGGDLDGEAGLADPADPDERQQSSRTERVQPGQLETRPTIAVTAAGRFERPNPNRCRRRRAQLLVMGEDRLLDSRSAGPGSIPNSADIRTRARP